MATRPEDEERASRDGDTGGEGVGSGGEAQADDVGDELEASLAAALTSMWRNCVAAEDPLDPSLAFYLPDSESEDPGRPHPDDAEVEGATPPREPSIFDCLLEVVKERDPTFDVEVPKLPARPPGMSRARCGRVPRPNCRRGRRPHRPAPPPAPGTWTLWPSTRNKERAAQRDGLRLLLRLEVGLTDGVHFKAEGAEGVVLQDVATVEEEGLARARAVRPGRARRGEGGREPGRSRTGFFMLA